jgi:hypothetical protein
VKSKILPPRPSPPRHKNCAGGRPLSSSSSSDSSDTEKARQRFKKNQRLCREQKISQQIARVCESTLAPHITVVSKKPKRDPAPQFYGKVDKDLRLWLEAVNEYIVYNSEEFGSDEVQI